MYIESNILLESYNFLKLILQMFLLKMTEMKKTKDIYSHL